MGNKYFDIQVNGYGGVDYNQNNLTLEDLRLSCSKLKDDDVEGILATIITADFEDMILRIRKIVDLREQDELVHKIIRGIHIEGPFLNSADGYRGAHPKAHILRPEIDKLKELLDAADGLCRIFTLAPEIDTNNLLTRHLSSHGIIISAGHCNPNLEILKSAIDAGLSMFTHLGNGCPQSLPRHDNIIQRVLSLKDDLKICFIADGIHIPFYALKNYIEIAGIENCIITTDAMAAAGAKAGRYTISNIELEVGEDRIVREPGKPNFAGSAIDMPSSAFNLKTEIGLTSEEVVQLTSFNPSLILKTKT
ncbi:MAG: N-acetylglucosamine-6-phosphate deacetylase [Bacteroidetes bacterium]|nr:MAG: N-acetylglucosamine-6-phosphate deacetylase [Bacteroidota bacterium]